MRYLLFWRNARDRNSGWKLVYTNWKRAHSYIFCHVTLIWRANQVYSFTETEILKIREDPLTFEHANFGKSNTAGSDFRTDLKHLVPVSRYWNVPQILLLLVYPLIDIYQFGGVKVGQHMLLPQTLIDSDFQSASFILRSYIYRNLTVGTQALIK